MKKNRGEEFSGEEFSDEECSNEEFSSEEFSRNLRAAVAVSVVWFDFESCVYVKWFY
jgi:hypothetical protein